MGNSNTRDKGVPVIDEEASVVQPNTSDKGVRLEVNPSHLPATLPHAAAEAGVGQEASVDVQPGSLITERLPLGMSLDVEVLPAVGPPPPTAAIHIPGGRGIVSGDPAADNTMEFSVFGSPLMSPSSPLQEPPVFESNPAALSASAPPTIGYPQVGSEGHSEGHSGGHGEGQRQCTVAFAWQDPKALQVSVTGTFNKWGDPIPLRRAADGVFRLTMELPAVGTCQYVPPRFSPSPPPFLSPSLSPLCEASLPYRMHRGWPLPPPSSLYSPSSPRGGGEGGREGRLPECFLQPGLCGCWGQACASNVQAPSLTFISC